jgi:hypothetical protein
MMNGMGNSSDPIMCNLITKIQMDSQGSWLHTHLSRTSNGTEDEHKDDELE